jgi:pyruvate dehydrogenase E1 component alpha subunit
VSTIDSRPADRAGQAKEAEALYASMALIKRFEQVAYRAYERGEIEGTIHASIGQEATAVGVISELEPNDKVLSHHRGHGHALAKGVDPGRLMAELCGRATGVSGGKGGSMHATDVGCGFLGTLAVVGSSIPLAVGVALGLRRAGESGVCTVFFGDGAVNQGVLYESLNLAAIWELPVLFVCENNSYAITTAAQDYTAGEGIRARAAGFGIASVTVDGQDVLAVRREAGSLLERVRGGAPAVLECLTYRFMGHSRGDPPHGVYRTKDELEEWQNRDPLVLLARSAGVSEDARERIERKVRERVDAALKFALESPRPGRDALEKDIWG